MYDREKEFKNAFYFCKRWANSPLTPSYTYGYSRGNADKEPAQKVYNYILTLQYDKKIDFESKIEKLNEFLIELDKNQPQGFFGTNFYSGLISYIRRSKVDIENERSVQTRRLKR